MSRVKVACIQNCAGPDMGASISEAESLCRRASWEGAEFLLLPEFFSCLKVDEDAFELGDELSKEPLVGKDGIAVQHLIERGESYVR